MSGYLTPGSKVYITYVDPYGLVGRVHHPPTGKTSTGLGKSPILFKKGYIVHYEGWDNGDGDFILRAPYDDIWKSSSDELFVDTYVEHVDPSAVFDMAKDTYDEHAVVDPVLPSTHYYYIVVSGYGAYQFADYEFEGGKSWLRVRVTSLMRGIVWRSRRAKRVSTAALSRLSTKAKD